MYRLPLQRFATKTKYFLQINRAKGHKPVVPVDRIPTEIDGNESKNSVPGIAEEKSTKLPARLPLVKNFFIGVADNELLGFPEVLERENLAKLQNDILPFKNYFEDAETLEVTDINTKLMDDVKQLGLFGINAPEKYGGRDYNVSGSLFATESETKCTDVALNLLSQRVIIDVLREIGTEEQLDKFLIPLTEGSLLACEAIYEKNIPEFEYFNTNAIYNSSSGSWLLNGQKSFVISGPLPANGNQLFIVVAETIRPDLTGDSARASTIFLVDSQQSGVEITERLSTTGCKGSHSQTVEFKNVKLEKINVLGEPFQGASPAENLLQSSRLRHAHIALGVMKNTLNNLSGHIVNTKQCGINLDEMELNKLQLSKILCDIYALESMIYLTAGILDEFEKPDVSIETALTKYFGLQNLLKVTQIPLQIIGPKALVEGELTEKYYRDAAQLFTQGESIDSLKLFIAVTGLQYAGELLQSNVTKQRNPLLHPGFIIKKIIQSSTIDEPKTKMHLSDNLHPTLDSAALSIEHSIARLHMSVETVFTHYGCEIIDHHGELERLTDMTAILYSMFASASRASRSYCIGLPMADHEMLIASTICQKGREDIKRLASDIRASEFSNGDKNYIRLSRQLAKSKKYFISHPLEYNF